MMATIGGSATEAMMDKGKAWLASGCLVLAACSSTADGEGVPPPVADAQQFLPAAFVVHLASPPRTLRVDGDTLVLTGPDGSRRLRVERNEALFDGRVVTARDAAGSVEVRVTQRLCLGEGGAQSPYTARVSIGDAAPLMGCGGPR